MNKSEEDGGQEFNPENNPRLKDYVNVLFDAVNKHKFRIAFYSASVGAAGVYGYENPVTWHGPAGDAVLFGMMGGMVAGLFDIAACGVKEFVAAHKDTAKDYVDCAAKHLNLK